MKIKRILNQNRRDFIAEFECEHCGNIEKHGGYDDSHFHINVVPEMTCKKCGKKAPEYYRPLATKYADGEQV